MARTYYFVALGEGDGLGDGDGLGGGGVGPGSTASSSIWKIKVELAGIGPCAVEP